MKQLLT